MKLFYFVHPIFIRIIMIIYLLVIWGRHSVRHYRNDCQSNSTGATNICLWSWTSCSWCPLISLFIHDGCCCSYKRPSLSNNWTETCLRVCVTSCPWEQRVVYTLRKTGHISIRMSQMITLKVTCWLDRTPRPSHKLSLPFKRHSCCPPPFLAARPSPVLCVCVCALSDTLAVGNEPSDGEWLPTRAECHYEWRLLRACHHHREFITTSDDDNGLCCKWLWMSSVFGKRCRVWLTGIFFLRTSETEKAAFGVPAGPWDVLWLRNCRCVNTLFLCWTAGLL